MVCVGLWKCFTETIDPCTGNWWVKMCLEYGTKSWKGHFKKGKAIQSDSFSVSLSVATIACTPQTDDSSSTEHTLLLSTFHEVQGSGLNYGFIINVLVFWVPSSLSHHVLMSIVLQNSNYISPIIPHSCFYFLILWILFLSVRNHWLVTMLWTWDLCVHMCTVFLYLNCICVPA